MLDVGRVKNPNKNPVGERAVQELEAEILKQDPSGGPISEVKLSAATARLNARIRSRGLSSREMLYQRDQFSNEQIPVSDREIIVQQHHAKLRNHPYSEKVKATLKDYRPDAKICVGDLVYLHSDRDKTKARQRYLVVRTDYDWIYIRKFTGKQLRNASYKVKRCECFKVPSTLLLPDIPETPDKEEDIDHGLDTTLDRNLSEQFTINQPSKELNHPLERAENYVDNYEIQMNSDIIEPENESNASNAIASRPHRNKRQPEKLTLRWDSTQSYE